MRFTILTELLNGTIQIGDVKIKAGLLKKLSSIKIMFQRMTNKKTWEECCREFPAHTQEAALEPFLNKDFKKGVPMEFVDYIEDAHQCVESGSSSFEHLRMEPVTLSVMQVDTKEVAKMRRVIGNLKTGTKHVALLSEGVEVAAAWMAEMRKQGFCLLGETSVIRETHVTHLIMATNGKELAKTLPKKIPEASAFKTLIDMFSEREDRIAIGADMEDVCDTAKAMGRKAERIHCSSSVNNSSSSIDNSNSRNTNNTYEFSDSDSTNIE